MTRQTQTSHIGDFLETGEYIHVQRIKMNAGGHRGVPLHNHDFLEVFWVESGKGVHQINGNTHFLSSGDIAMIRPVDTHSLTFANNNQLQLVNVAFRKEEFDSIITGYPEARDSFWRRLDRQPLALQLSPRKQNNLSLSADLLLDGEKTKMMLHWFLLDLFRILQDDVSECAEPTLPGWLQSALLEIQKKENFQQSGPVLASISNRSVEHVSRVTKKLLNQTPSEIVNRTRLDYAGRLLLNSDTDILTIAMDCGFNSISQFHRLFKVYYQMTPKQYRNRIPAIN